MNYTKNWLKEGVEVAHVDNLGQRMFVEKLLYTSKEFGEEGGKTKVHKLFSGVKCHWWEYAEDEGGKVFRMGEFHAKELLPYEIAVTKDTDKIAKFQFEQQ